MSLFTELGGKLYQWLEGKDDYAWAYHAPSDAAMHTVLERYSFSEQLPYFSYDPKRKLYHNQDTVAFSLQCTPLVGADQKVQKLLGFLFTNLPAGVVVQVTLYASPKIGDILDHYVYSKKKHGASDLHCQIASQYAEYLKQGAYTSILGTQENSMLVRYYQIFFSVILEATAVEPNSVLLNLRSQLKATLASIGVYTKELEPTSLIRLCRELAEGEKSSQQEKIIYDPTLSIARQAATPNLHLVIEKEKFSIKESIIKTFYAEHFPLYASQSSLQEIIGGMLEEKGSKIPCPYLFTFLYHVPPTDELSTLAKAHNWDKKAKNSWRNFIPLIDEINADWKRAIKAIKKGDKKAECAFFVTLYTNASNAETITSQVISHFDYHQWKLKPISALILPSWMANFPMLPSLRWLTEAKKYGFTKTIMASNAASLIPLQGEWLGNNEPLLIFPGINGQLIKFNPFDSLFSTGGNANITVSGKSGSGKSFLMQQLEQAVHACGGQVFAFDEGCSHQKPCELHGGLFLDLAQTKGVVINPFTNATNLEQRTDLEHSDTIALFKSMIIQMGFRKRDANDIEEGLIEEAIMATWHDYGQDNDITKIQQWLYQKAKTEQDLMAHDIARALFPYTKDGMYGKFFNGRANLDFNNRFVVLEIGGLKRQPELQAVILMLTMHQITQYLDNHARSQIKLVSADESWRYFTKKSSALFFDSTARTIRKHGGSLMMASQSINDWYSNPSGIAIFENSNYKLTLEMEAEAIVQLRKNDRLQMDDFKMQALQNLKTINELYSEIMIEGPHGYAIVRAVVDPFQKTLFSTTPHIFEAIKQKRKEGMSLYKAVEIVKEQLVEENSK
jgi:conjugal transfer ATP-binding protein TraC